MLKLILWTLLLSLSITALDHSHNMLESVCSFLAHFFLNSKIALTQVARFLAQLM